MQTRKLWIVKAATAWLALSLAGCLNWQSYPQQGLLVPSPWLPEQPRVLITGHAARYLGVFGNLLAATDQRSKSQRLALAMQQRAGFGLRQRAMAELDEQLRVAGLEPAHVEQSRGPDFLADWPAGHGPLLDLQLRFAGFVAERPGSPYQPVVQLVWRLLEASDGRLLDSGLIVYGSGRPQPDTLSLPGDPAWVFADYPALLREPEHAATGLEVALDASFAALARELQRSGL